MTENTPTKPPYKMIAMLLAGAFIALLNNTLLNVALPSIMADFDISPATVQWLTTGYMLVNGILIPITAFLIQKFSVRGLFLTAMTLFTLGTALAGFSHSFPVLMAGRVIQASGSAIMMPLLMNVMLTSFPVEKRGSAMGIFGLVMVFAPAIGPTLSGWIVEHYEWRVLFYMMLPFAIVTLLLAVFRLYDNKQSVHTHLDVMSVILSSIGFGGILYGFSAAGDKGWASLEVYGTIVIGVVGLVLFITRQFQLEKPMLDFRIYKYPMFALSSAISLTVTMGMFGGMLLMPLYIQTVRGISPFHAGLLMLPGALIMGAMSPITGRLFDKFGGRILAITGLLITIVTSYFFTTLALDTSYTELIMLYSFRMFGMSMLMMPVMTNGLNQLPARMNPHGTAMNNTLNQVAGAVGSALLVTIMSTQTRIHAEELAGTIDPALLGQQAMVEGINDAFMVTVYVSIIALVLAFFMKRAKPAEDSNEELPGRAEDLTEAPNHS
ncbi:DHA2 family efflux MFS transporter permease subunit [Shouchella clausii]|uniref:MFS transporter n=2 Tax=Shouchella TaxID=2893057 RepID=A0A268NXB4_SHOCL|nr:MULTISPECIES: DHA2 family efflux MFS transporter permease subunit [Shouchella]MCM3313903.1 DHA2 family efflux MFS transporter permease subunit [Psychrobacillus sp. MER TA 17]ALA51378.1 Multidrug resistance protein B [Shouchella clausii]KKI88136.1 MFS transporter [Shouchella clausii]MBU3232786.1 DHA2 family efflux MFS transporter permease subunit [Shouchella clausii]MBU3265683.1 DHA2 family efflux MFS transporter permease subunit [Shouchella clausii]